MPTTITSETAAVEESTFVVTAAFTDAAGSAVTPATLNWTLTDTALNIINSRSVVSITPSTSVDIVLTGDDLAFQSGETGKYARRIITLQGTYDSTEGSGLHIKDECRFSIINLAYIT